MIVPRPRLGILDEERQVRALPPGEGRGRRRARRDRARPIGGGGRSGPAGRRGSMRKTGITVAERWDGWGRGLPTGDLRRTPGHVRADGRAPGARPWPPLWDRRPCRQNAAEGAAGREREVPGGPPGGRSGVDGVRPRTGRDGVGQEGHAAQGRWRGPRALPRAGAGSGAACREAAAFVPVVGPPCLLPVCGRGRRGHAGPGQGVLRRVLRPRPDTRGRVPGPEPRCPGEISAPTPGGVARARTRSAPRDRGPPPRAGRVRPRSAPGARRSPPGPVRPRPGTGSAVRPP